MHHITHWEASRLVCLGIYEKILKNIQIEEIENPNCEGGRVQWEQDGFVYACLSDIHHTDTCHVAAMNLK